MREKPKIQRQNKKKVGGGEREVRGIKRNKKGGGGGGVWKAQIQAADGRIGG